MDLIAFIVTMIIFCGLIGVISKIINEKKGYEGGFAWGFFLGIIGIIVVACRSGKQELYSAGWEYTA